VRIEADGKAIPQEVLPRFFDLLAVDQHLCSGGDLGLAPPLAARIMALYEGKVSVENLIPPGVRLTVRLKPDTTNPTGRISTSSKT
jgi:K+-sensing histidine kinase KdpD